MLPLYHHVACMSKPTMNRYHDNNHNHNHKLNPNRNRNNARTDNCG